MTGNSPLKGTSGNRVGRQPMACSKPRTIRRNSMAVGGSDMVMKSTGSTPDAERNLLAMGLWLLACVLGPGWSVVFWVWSGLEDVGKA